MKLTNYPGEAIVLAAVGIGVVCALAFGVFVKADTFGIICVFAATATVAIIAVDIIERHEENGGEGMTYKKTGMEITASERANIDWLAVSRPEAANKAAEAAMTKAGAKEADFHRLRLDGVRIVEETGGAE